MQKQTSAFVLVSKIERQEKLVFSTSTKIIIDSHFSEPD